MIFLRDVDADPLLDERSRFEKRNYFTMTILVTGAGGFIP